MISVAIDGPVGSGKSTVARLVAKGLRYTYIDTGAMYRGIALKAKRAGVSWDDTEEMGRLAEGTEVELQPTTVEGLTCMVRVDGREVSREIRDTDIGQGASKIGTIPRVRRALVGMQRAMAAQGGVVMEGRDIGTVVLPDAELKIFLTGTVEERAKRRFLELQKKGKTPVMGKVIEEVKARDHQDSTRADSPLRKAAAAVEVDTTGMSIQQVVDAIVKLAREAMDK
ncbi:MAG: (d)CMP kinase [Candidatus Aureabacteria bacterium]|nr:(d)CMP kinase [Candidatus Auribacterota bacterium]